MPLLVSSACLKVHAAAAGRSAAPSESCWLLAGGCCRLGYTACQEARLCCTSRASGACLAVIAMPPPAARHCKQRRQPKQVLALLWQPGAGSPDSQVHHGKCGMQLQFSALHLYCQVQPVRRIS